MAKKKVALTVPQELLLEPIIHTMSQQFNLVTNIRLADITEEKGWLVLELEGNEKRIEEGLAWVMARGVRVDPARKLGRLSPYLKHHRVVRVRAGNGSFVRVFLPGKRAAELQHLGEGENGLESPRAHPRRRALPDDELITDLMPGFARPLLRYNFSDYLVQFVFLVKDALVLFY